MESEKQRLENIARDYDNPLSAREISGFEIEYCFEIFKRFYRGGAVLEMGPAEGVMTERLCGFVEELEVLEGSAVFCENLSKRFEGLRVHNALFEEFCPQKSYSAIVMGHVLEHVENPKEILELVKNWLKKGDSLGGGGIIFAAVPNSHSLHRQAAVEMGLLESEKSMSEADMFHGHRRIYDLDAFVAEFKNAGFEIVSTGGYWLKPLSNAQIQAHWNPQMIAAFMRLGEIYPQIAGDVYVVARESGRNA